MSLRRLSIVLVFCLAGLGGLTAVGGAPPPTHLCGVCGSDVLNEGGVAGATEPGTLDVYVDETGDSRWVARVPVNDTAAERYEDPAALEAAVDGAWVSYHAASGDREAVESTLENGTVVVTYTVEDVARLGVGEGWIVDYFATGSSNTRYRLAADRVTIHAPDGTVVTNSPRYATVDGNRVTWSAAAEDHFESDFDDQTYVTYGPEGIAGTASGYATIGLEIGPRSLERGAAFGIAPGAVLAIAGLAVGRVEWGADAVDAEGLERLLVAVGALGTVGLIALGAAAPGRPVASGFGTLSGLGVGYAALAVAARRYGSRLGARGLGGLSGLATVATGAAMAAVGGPSLALIALQFGLATALFLPIGYAFERGARPVGPLLVVALVPVGVAATLSPIPAALFSHVLFWILIGPWLVAVAVFGYPLALLGRRLAADGPT